LDVVDGEVQAVAGVAPVGVGRVGGRAADDVAGGGGVGVRALDPVGQRAEGDALAPATEVRGDAVRERDRVEAVVGGAGVVVAVGRGGPVDVAHAPAAARPLGALGVGGAQEGRDGRRDEGGPVRVGRVQWVQGLEEVLLLDVGQDEGQPVPALG